MKILPVLALLGLMLLCGCVSNQPQLTQPCICKCANDAANQTAPTQSTPAQSGAICNCPECPVNPLGVQQSPSPPAIANSTPAGPGTINPAPNPPAMNSTPAPSGPLPASPPVPTAAGGVTEQACTSAGGYWNGCGSACRGAPPGTICPMFCVAYCECGGGYGCPGGYQCGNYLPAGSSNATGICMKNSS